jgi:hypothetical protein
VQKIEFSNPYSFPKSKVNKGVLGVILTNASGNAKPLTFEPIITSSNKFQKKWKKTGNHKLRVLIYIKASKAPAKNVLNAAIKENPGFNE